MLHAPFLKAGLGLAMLLAVACPSAMAEDTPKLTEAPMLAERVKASSLPPLEQRAPKTPRILKVLDGQTLGTYGGTLNQLIERAADIRRMSAFGHARLVTYTRSYDIVPDILREFKVDEGRIFTFTLREGHRWSDGEPFTTEDFRYFWEDVAGNIELTPEGPPKEMLVDGKAPKVEVVDKTTIRFTWEQPNPGFLPALAAATPLTIYRPAHYLKKFHKRYAKADKLAEQIAKRNRRDWIDLHYNRDRVFRLDNPDYPSLDPWVNTTPSPADRFIFERNPYFHRFDAKGLQLPYIDKVALTVTGSKLIPAKVGAGEVELQSRGLQFNNYTLLKRAEVRQNFKVRLWRSGRGSQMALFPNLTASDPVWRSLMRDERFRRAMSLAIDRHEINQVIYYGLAHEAGNGMLADTPLYVKNRSQTWAHFDLKAANALLDDVGLVTRDGRGIRQLPDGRPLEIIVETAGESTEHADVLELIRDSWAQAGIGLFIKPQTAEVLRKRLTAGAAVMTVYFGLDNGIANPNYAPAELAPTNETQQSWPQWGLNHVSSGKSGEKIDVPAVSRLSALYDTWMHSDGDEQRRKVWVEMLDIHADQVITIGIVNSVPQPVVISNRLHNVPEVAVYSWDPGGHFGVFLPDTFWLDAEQKGS